MLIKEVHNLTPFQRLVYWIREREAVRLKKEAGEPWPWTDDIVLQTFRFCNVRRMDDRVSRWLMENWYGTSLDHHNTVVAAVLARFFNLPDTLRRIRPLVYRGGSPDLRKIGEVVKGIRLAGGKVFNSAYMITGIGGGDKVDQVTNLVCRPLIDAPPTIDVSSMEVSVSNLLPYWGFSSFMAGQVVADLRWVIEGPWSDRNNWAPLGPGSIRGLNRLYRGSVKASKGPRLVLYRLMAQTVEDLRESLPISVSGRLEAMDYQNCLCEYDKYSRVLLGEGRPKQLYRGCSKHAR